MVKTPNQKLRAIFKSPLMRGQPKPAEWAKESARITALIAEGGLDHEERDDNNDTLLGCAVRFVCRDHERQICRWLIEDGANPLVADPKPGISWNRQMTAAVLNAMADALESGRTPATLQRQDGGNPFHVIAEKQVHQGWALLFDMEMDRHDHKEEPETSIESKQGRDRVFANWKIQPLTSTGDTPAHLLWGEKGAIGRFTGETDAMDKDSEFIRNAWALTSMLIDVAKDALILNQAGVRVLDLINEAVDRGMPISEDQEEFVDQLNADAQRYLLETQTASVSRRKDKPGRL